MLKIIIGLIGIAAGFMLVWKSEWIYQNFGGIAWAEKHFGTEGGSRIFYKLIGIFVILVSILIMTGLIGGIIKAIFSRLFMVQ